MIQKSRDQWIPDYISALQLEYISYYARLKLYTRPIDIKRFGDICQKKKEKIDNMTFRNMVNGIFHSKEVYDKYVKKFIRDAFGVPAFQYINADQEYRVGYWDKFYFFITDSTVEYAGKEYKVIKNHILTEEVILNVDSELRKVPYAEVKRDITSLFDHYHEKS